MGSSEQRSVSCFGKQSRQLPPFWELALTVSCEQKIGYSVALCSLECITLVCEWPRLRGLACGGSRKGVDAPTHCLHSAAPGLACQ